jgi:hypothetical protein
VNLASTVSEQAVWAASVAPESLGCRGRHSEAHSRRRGAADANARGRYTSIAAEPAISLPDRARAGTINVPLSVRFSQGALTRDSTDVTSCARAGAASIRPVHSVRRARLRARD